MKTRLKTVAYECVRDLSITLIYAVIVGVLITAIVASDETPASILRVGLYTLLLPAAAVALIAGEIALRVLQEWRAAKRKKPTARMTDLEMKSQAG